MADNGSTSNTGWPFSPDFIKAEGIPKELNNLQLYALIKQATIEGALESTRRTQTHKADLIRKELLGG